jgi:hypothetical protein
MGTSQHGLSPPELVRGQHQLQAWREHWKPGCRIPQSLRSVAVRLVYL